MAIFYIDSDNFLTATAVYTTPALNVKQDGVYGYCGYARQQIGGVLKPPVPCESGAVGCVLEPKLVGETGTTVSTAGSGNANGMYDFKVNISNPDQITFIRIEMTVTATQSSTAFIFQFVQNGMPNPSSPIPIFDGRRSATALLAATGGTTPIVSRYTYGTAGDSCNAVGTQINGIKLYQRYNAGWTYTNTNLSEFITDGISLAANPGTMVMYMPINGAEGILHGRIIEACAVGGYSSTATIKLQDLSGAIQSTNMFATSAAACGAARNTFLYQGEVNGAPGSTFGLYDFVYNFDKQSFAADGYYALDYGTPKAWIRVQNGIVTQLGNCP